MTKRQELTLISDEQARTLAKAAYDAAIEAAGPNDAHGHTGAWHEAHVAVLGAYPADTFCVRREKPIHKAIREQAREAANAAVPAR